MIIAVDFDGTCVEHEYPAIGQEITGCSYILNKIATSSRGHKIILYTMRSGRELTEAVKWFKDRGIPLWGINSNPEQIEWTTSPKVHADVYIDDAALGCPTITFPGKRPVVDWGQVHIWLANKGCY